MKRHCIFICILVLWSTRDSAVWGENWPAWRGPQADGVSGETKLPFTWGPERNILWKVPLPEPGNSTPIVWGQHVFITQSLDKGKRRALIAFARTDGKKLWQREVSCPIQETSHPQNPPCSGSPVTDGKAVYAHFASAGVVAYDFAGKRLWHRDLGQVLHKWGNGSSPILYKNLLIVYQGPGEPTFLIALDKQTGKTIWKKEEPGINSPIFGSWSTPVVVRAGQRDELIMALPGDKVGGLGEFKAYDPQTGSVLWRCTGLGTEVYAMPVMSTAGDLIVGISGHNGPTMAVRPGGQGDVTSSHRVWQVAGKLPQRIGSGILHEHRLFLADAEGFVECLDAKNGKNIWKARLPGRLWGSLLLAEGKLYVSSLEGQTFVLAAAGKFHLLATNDLREPIYASLAVSDGNFFLRTYQHLYCIGKR
jgi:outer membrane protein assembly factor BamB